MPSFNSHYRAVDGTVDPGIAIAVIAAILDKHARNFGVMVSLGRARHVQVPDFMNFGYGVTVADGTILPPPDKMRSFDVDGPVFASARVDLESVEGGSPIEKLKIVLPKLAQITAEGWQIELGRKINPVLDRSVPAMHAGPDELRGQTATVLEHPPNGTGVLIGIVDFGCDFAHPAFRTKDGRTRLQMLWDQNTIAGRGTARPGLPGRFFSRHAIDEALRSADPYATLGYYPLKDLYSPSTALPGEPLHGTHVMGVAAGRDVSGCAAGVAPGAELAFVHLQPGALVADGDTVDVFDAVCSIFHHAASRPLPAVVNLSVGANSGPHDGSTIFDRALDAVLRKPARAITVAAGNARQQNWNAQQVVRPGAPATLRWRFNKGDMTSNVLRVFCTAKDGQPPLRCTIIDPKSRRTDLGEERHDLLEIIADRKRERVGLAYAGIASPADGLPLQHIEIRLAPDGTREEVWEVELSLTGPEDRQAAIGEVAIQAWIERDDRLASAQSAFVPPDNETPGGCSLSSIACGQRTICVGAYDPTAMDMGAASFSSAGPTRDGRTKPDVVAPGINVRAAYALGGRLPNDGPILRNPMRGRMSGTSVAAPHVAGVVALMLQVNDKLDAEDILHGLQSTTQIRAPTAALENGKGRYWLPDFGYGRVDAAAAVRWAYQHRTLRSPGSS